MYRIISVEAWRRLASEAGGLSPARGPALGAEHLALSGLEPSRKDVLGGRLSQKKGTRRPSFCLKKCPPAPSPRNRSCLPLWRYTIIRDAMSICFVGGASDGCRPKLHRWPFGFLHLVVLPTILRASPSFRASLA